VTTRNETLRTCKNGHQYYKSSDCPVCPYCEQQRRPVEVFLSSIAAPARRALENNNINALKKLSKYSEADILKLHGMGPGSIPTLRDTLKRAGLSFKHHRR
jgi:hypothetical protein